MTAQTPWAPLRSAPGVLRRQGGDPRPHVHRVRGRLGERLVGRPRRVAERQAAGRERRHQEQDVLLLGTASVRIGRLEVLGAEVRRFVGLSTHKARKGARKPTSRDVHAQPPNESYVGTAKSTWRVPGIMTVDTLKSMEPSMGSFCHPAS